MFKSWREYALYLADNLADDKEFKDKINKHVESNTKYMITNSVYVDFYRTLIKTILSQDFDFTKLSNFLTNPYFNTVKKYVNGKINKDNFAINKKYNRYINELL